MVSGMPAAASTRRPRRWPIHCRRVLALLLAAGAFASQLSCADFLAVGSGKCANRRHHAAGGVIRIPRAAGLNEDDAWREAYATELERNRLLREQLQSRGGEAGAAADS